VYVYTFPFISIQKKNKKIDIIIFFLYFLLLLLNEITNIFIIRREKKNLKINNFKNSHLAKLIRQNYAEKKTKIYFINLPFHLVCFF